jgi:hypothetical protein
MNKLLERATCKLPLKTTLARCQCHPILGAKPGKMGFIRLACIWGLCPQPPGIFRFGANPGAEGNCNGHPAVLLINGIAPGLARKR